MTTTIEILGDENIIEIIEESVQSVESSENSTIVIETSPPKGDKGDQGEPGINGNVTSDYNSGVTLSGHRMVILEDGLAYYADCTILSHAHRVVGMTTGASIEGNSVTILPFGIIEESSWNWELNIPIWLQENGLISQSPPLTGFCLVIGTPINPTSLFLHIREPIILE